MKNNPFDVYTADELGGLDGFFDKIKKSVKRFTKKVVKVKDKIDAIHDAAPIIGKHVGKLRRKIEDSPTGRKVVSTVAGFFGGPAAAYGAMEVLTEQSKQRADAKAAQEAAEKEAAFLASEEGKLFKENQEKFAAAIKEMKSTAQYKEIYEKMKADGYTDAQIAEAWIKSRPVKEVATAATADVIFPAALKEAQRQGSPYPYETAAGASLQVAERAVARQQAVNTTAQQNSGGANNALPWVVAIGSLLLLGG